MLERRPTSFTSGDFVMRFARQRVVTAFIALLVCALAATLVLAQAGGGQGPGGGPGAGGPQRFDPAQFRQMMLDRLREQLKASDEEWGVLQPKLEKVMQ